MVLILALFANTLNAFAGWAFWPSWGEWFVVQTALVGWTLLEAYDEARKEGVVR